MDYYTCPICGGDAYDAGTGVYVKTLSDGTIKLYKYECDNNVDHQFWMEAQ